MPNKNKVMEILRAEINKGTLTLEEVQAFALKAVTASAIMEMAEHNTSASLKSFTFDMGEGGKKDLMILVHYADVVEGGCADFEISMNDEGHVDLVKTETTKPN